MEFLVGIFLFILGIIIGSFLNVVIYRYNTGMGINGRSKCFSCGKTLQWYELVPLISYIFLRGRCSVCQSKISWQYPAVELLTGLTFLALFLKFGLGVQLLMALIVASIFIVILVYDMRHKIIPDGLVVILSVCALISLFITPDLSLQMPRLVDVLAGPLLALPFALLWLVSGGRWMGLGDAKLALPMGWILGVSLGFSSIIIAFWTGAAVGIVLMATDKIFHRGNVSMKSEIPFAPFLILGLAIVFFSGLDVLFLGELLR
jgi:leader peptidase (prepilin peptidase) / N-methyltransferase